MVSNQSVRRSSGAAFGLLGGLSVLALASGCQLLSRKEPAVAPVAQSQSRPAPPPVAAPQTAIDAAIALAGSEPQAAPAPAAPPPPPVMKSDAPLSYTVKRGDTLWEISSMFLRDPWLWPEIWHVNPSVQNPHLIYPGDVLTLAYGASGEPQVQLTRGNALRVQPLVRSTALEGPIATIPFDAIKAFLGRPSMLSAGDIKNAPRVTGMRDRHMIAGIGHEFYVKDMEALGPGRYAVVRVADPLKDPETGKVLGYMGIYTGAARIDQVAKLSKAVLIDSARETTVGNLLFAEDMQTVSADIFPRSPPAGVSGQIMAVVDGVALIGQHQVVAINRGSKDGLETGHVLAIDVKGETVADGSCRRSLLSFCYGKNVSLPSERAGTLLVFKTFERMSYGLVVGADVPLRVSDRVRTP